MRTPDQTQGDMPLMSASTQALNVFLGCLPRQSVEVDKKIPVERQEIMCPTSIDTKWDKNYLFFEEYLSIDSKCQRA